MLRLRGPFLNSRKNSSTDARIDLFVVSLGDNFALLLALMKDFLYLLMAGGSDIDILLRRAVGTLQKATRPGRRISAIKG